MEEVYEKDCRRNVVYNLDEEYIADVVEEYFEEEEEELWEGYEVREVSGEPQGHEYGGEWYKKGKESTVCSSHFIL